MIKTILCEKNENTKNVIENYLKETDDIKLSYTVEDIFLLEDVKTVDIIIFDINSENSDNILQQVKKIKTINPNIKFIATSNEINSELVVKVLKNDVDEFLLKPLIKNILISSIKKLVQFDPNKVNLGTISIFSNKGGIGKTSIAINLAWEIYKKTKEKVCLLDLSFNQEDVSAFLDIKQKFDANYIFSNIESKDEELLLSLIPCYKNSKVYILSAGNGNDFVAKHNPKFISKIINSLKNIFSYIIIDTPNMVNDTIVTVLNNSNLIYLLSTMNMASIRNCQKSCELFDKLEYNSDKIKLIINRYIDNSEISPKEIEKLIGKEIFHKIPNNYLTINDAINNACVLDEINPKSNIAKAYNSLANKTISLDFLSLNEENKKNSNYVTYNLLRRMGE